MKKLIVMAALMVATPVALRADVIVTNVNMTAQTVVTQVKVVKNVKVVWTDFKISYQPPSYSNATYSVTYLLKDADTGATIPNSARTQALEERDVFAFAQRLGIDFSQMGQGIGYLLNEYLKTVLAK